MKIDSLIYDEIPILKIDGKIIGDGSQILKSEIEKEVNKGNNRIILDLSQSDLIDSSALGTMVAFLISLQRKEGKLVLLSPQRMVRDILDITRLNMLFEIYDGLEEALGSLKKAQEK